MEGLHADSCINAGIHQGGICHEYFCFKNSINYFNCVQHAGRSPVTHHTTPSNKDWVTIDYKHTLQSIHSTLGRSAETYPTTLSHRDWDLPVHTYLSTGWDMNPQPWRLKPQARPLGQWVNIFVSGGNYLLDIVWLVFCEPLTFCRKLEFDGESWSSYLRIWFLPD